MLVMYGSQTGNSEQAAKELSAQMRTKLTPLIAKHQKDNNIRITVTPKLMQLDDFLEMEQAKWTRLVVIVVSSYGIGQAPLGARRFRELIDYFIEAYTANEAIAKDNTTDPPNMDSSSSSDIVNDPSTTTTPPPLLLNGITFALCGLGDSKYPTFFQNPTAVWRGMQLAGAVHVGPLGKADASSGRDLEIISEWRDDIWQYLAPVIATEPPHDQMKLLQQMQQDTLEICYRLNPDMKKRLQQQQKQLSLPLWTIAVAVAVLVLAVAAFYAN